MSHQFPAKHITRNVRHRVVCEFGGPTRGAACTSRPLPTYFCASGMPMALFFEDFSPISSKHKSVKSLKSLYGADMMTGCLSLEVHY